MRAARRCRHLPARDPAAKLGRMPTSPVPASRKKQRWIWFGSTVVLLVLGVVIGLILQNVWLGLLLAAIVSVGWLIAVESRRGDNAGVNDESHGIEI